MSSSVYWLVYRYCFESIKWAHVIKIDCIQLGLIFLYIIIIVIIIESFKFASSHFSQSTTSLFHAHSHIHILTISRTYSKNYHLNFIHIYMLQVRRTQQVAQFLLLNQYFYLVLIPYSLHYDMMKWYFKVQIMFKYLWIMFAWSVKQKAVGVMENADELALHMKFKERW